MNSNKKLLLVLAALMIAVFAIGCGGESKEEKQADANAAQAQEQAKKAEKQAKEATKQAKKEAKQAQNMSAEEKKQAAAAAAAQAGEQSAQAEAAQESTDAANAEAAAAAAAAAKKSSGGGSGGGTASAGGSQSCGGGVEVNAVTSCAFADNVVAAWKKNEGSTVNAYSPDTGKTYTMSCSGSQMLTTCTGGAGAKVTFTP